MIVRYFRVNESETNVVKQLLQDYGIATGQIINYTKCSMSFSRNVHPALQDRLCNILEVSGTTHHGMYLGIPSFIGMNKRMVFYYLKDRVWKKLHNWNTKKPSGAGKEILLKTMAQELPHLCHVCSTTSFVSLS